MKDLIKTIQQSYFSNFAAKVIENKSKIGMNLLQKYFSIIALLIFVFSCTNLQTEDEKFTVFQDRFDKTYQKVFPQRVETSVDNLIDFRLTDKEILRKVNFCKEHLNRLDEFDIAALSKENRAEFKEVFGKLKQGLTDMENAANELTNQSPNN